VTAQHARLLRAAVGLALMPPTEPELRVLHRWLDSWASIGRIVVGMAGLRPATDAIRRARVARDVLHRWDGTLADERDGHPWHAVQRRRAVTHPLRRLWCHFIITPLTTALILAGCAASVGQLYYVAVAAVTSTEVSKCSTTESARARQP